MAVIEFRAEDDVCDLQLGRIGINIVAVAVVEECSVNRDGAKHPVEISLVCLFVSGHPVGR